MNNLANEDHNSIRGAVWLIDDNSFSSRFHRGGASGWDLDERCRTASRDSARGNLLCTDGVSKYDVYGKRDIRCVKNGCVGFHNSYNVHYGEGFYIRFLDAAREKTAFEIAAKDGVFTANGIKTDTPCTPGTYFFELRFDLDKREVCVYINNRIRGTFKLCSEGLGRLIYGVKAASDTCVLPGFTRMYANYLLMDCCECYIPAPLCDRWEVRGTGARGELIGADEGHVYALYAENGEKASVTRRFNKTDGRIDCEVMCRVLQKEAVGEVSLLCGDAAAVTLRDTDGKIFCGDTLLREHHEYVWQTFRVEADTVTHDVKLFVNHKACGSAVLPESVTSFDGIRLTVCGAGDAAMYFKNIVVKPLYPEPEDYVPKPRVPKKTGCHVGINVCSLWRNGQHFGWDVITPFPENKTYLGWYDEGLPEVADWEIKWLCESGVDFELYCWYNGRENAPLVCPGFHRALFEGHLRAKYADHMKFGIIWEAANGGRTNEASFRKYLVPYWMDYFFSDPHYYTLHNKVVVSVFGADSLIRDFGSPENVAKQLDYVREQARTLGYDGAYFMACADPNDTVRRCGFDAVHAYSWAMSGYSPDYTKARMNMQFERKALPVIPTVSSGFNGIAWGYERSPLMASEDMGILFDWIKNDAMPRTGTDGDLVMLSTWNEYGEGTYLCPSYANGFGYLEQVRRAFTEPQTDFEWVRPDDKQLARLGYLFPENRALLRCRYQEPAVNPDTVVGTLPLNKESWTADNGVTMKNEGGALYLHGPIKDPKITMPVNIDAETVQGIRITLCGNTFGDALIVYFKREGDADYSEECSARVYCDTSERKTYDIPVGACSKWKGRITDIRIDPGDLPGDYVIGDITLCADNTSVRVTVDGSECRFPTAVRMKDGVPYIPFEHDGDLDKMMNLYHEWHPDTGTLYLLKEDKPLIFTVGSDSCVYGGETLKLDEPFGLFDGLPMINAKVLAKAFGYTLDIVGRQIAFKKA